MASASNPQAEINRFIDVDNDLSPSGKAKIKKLSAERFSPSEKSNFLSYLEKGQGVLLAMKLAVPATAIAVFGAAALEALTDGDPLTGAADAVETAREFTNAAGDAQDAVADGFFDMLSSLFS